MTSHEAGCPDCTDGLGRATPVEKDSWRHRIRSKPGLAQVWRIGVFVVGLLCVAVGLALAVLPGPLTIPPVLLGLWVWSTEFHWARRFFETFKEKGRAAWAHARLHPVSSVLITLGGVLALGVALVVVQRLDLVARTTEALGL